ncbi:acyltransferase domain-containing protein [Xanthobacteraceae bacterium A53D]
MSARRPIVFLFAGQGSQYHGMGAELLARHEVFAGVMAYGDRLLRDLIGESVLSAMHPPGKGIGDPFDRLAITHPAILLTEIALAKTLAHHGVRPDVVTGVSLGEIAAMTVAGMLPFEGALSLVARQPALFEATCPPGAMVACLAPAAEIFADPLLAAQTERAGISGPRHTILAVPEPAMAQVTARLTALGVVHQTLPVPFAFHARWIDPAESAVREATAHLRLLPAAMPVWSTVRQRQLAPTGGTDDALVWEIVRGEMRLFETFRHFEAAGGAVYIDLSPSGTLATLARQVIAPGSPSTTHALLTPFGADMVALDRVLQAVDAPGYAGAAPAR